MSESPHRTVPDSTMYLYRHLGKECGGALAMQERGGILRGGGQQKHSTGVARGLQASTGGVGKQDRIVWGLLMGCSCQLTYHTSSL